MKIADAFVNFQAKIANYKRNVEDAKRTFNNYSRSVQSNISTIQAKSQSFMSSLKNIRLQTVALWTGIAMFGRSVIAASKKQEQAVAGMNQALRSMGIYSESASKGIQKLASQMESEGIIADEDILRGTKFLVTYKDITEDLLPRTMRLMADIAALTEGDVVRAANLLGKASMGLTGELSRVGITLSDTAKKSKDFNLILSEMEAQVKGQNKALAATRAGALIQFTNAVGTLKEVMGDFLVEVLLPFVKILKPIVEWLTANVRAVKALIVALISLKIIMVAINAIMAANPIGAVLTVLGLLITAIVYVVDKMGGWEQAIDLVWTKLKQFWEYIEAFGEAMSNIFLNINRVLYSVVTFQFDKAKQSIDALKDSVINFGDAFDAAGEKADQFWNDYLKRKAKRQMAGKAEVQEEVKITVPEMAKEPSKEEKEALERQKELLEKRKELYKEMSDEIYKIEFGAYEDRIRIAREEHQERMKVLGDSGYFDSIKILSYEVNEIQKEQARELDRIQTEAAQKRIDEIMNLRDITEEEKLQRLEAEQDELDKSSEAWQLYNNKIREMNKTTTRIYQQGIINTINIVTNAMGNAIATGILEAQRFSTVWKNFCNQVIEAFTRMITEMLIKWAMFQALTAMGAPTWLTGGLKFWQHGGIVTKPTLGVVGEAGPEAIIPLSRLQDAFNGLVDTTDILSGNLHSIGRGTPSARAVNVSINWQTSLEGAVISDPNSMDAFYENVMQPAEKRFKARISEVMKSA